MRWLFIFLAVAQGWFPPLESHAYARTSRVDYDGGASLAKVAPVAGVSGDTFEGNLNSPSSLNRFVGFAGDSVNKVDPTGKYEIDVHQYLTTFLASAAGLSDAVGIGEAAQAADAPGSSKDAMYHGVSHKNMSLYHFVDGDRLAELRSVMLLDPFNREKIGDYFHALEDTFAHDVGEGIRSGTYYHDRMTGLGDIGHGDHGHEPDFTWNDVRKTDEMARTVYGELIALGKVRGNGSPSVSYDNVAKTVHDFARYHADTWMKNFDIAGVTVRQVSTATFEGYDSKIKILNPSYSLSPQYRPIYGDQATRAAEVHRNALSYQAIEYGAPLGGF